VRFGWLGLVLCVGLLAAAFVVYLIVRPGPSEYEATFAECEQSLQRTDQDIEEFPWSLYYAEELNACMIERGLHPQGLYNHEQVP